MTSLTVICSAVSPPHPTPLGVVAARDALLTFMVGGPASHFPQAEALLGNMGKNVVHCGDVGAGQVTAV